MKKIKLWSWILLLSMVCSLTACGGESSVENAAYSASAGGAVMESPEEPEAKQPEEETPDTQASDAAFSLGDVEAYTGQPYAVVHENQPYFLKEEITDQSYEFYSELDELGRCGVAHASIGVDLMPTEDRESIGQVKPSGWQTVKYDVVNGKYLYNRCHLIGFQLAGENANEKNLITGTRYLNVDGMLPYENMVADYVKETENHVMYRVTPIYEGDDLVASGVLMEAESVEDGGEDLQFCVYVYNVQPGVVIDYATGDSHLEESAREPETVPVPQEQAEEPEPAPQDQPEEPESAPQVQAEAPVQEPEPVQEPQPQGTDYILNTNTKKFHYPDCGSVKQMKESNKQMYTGSRDDVIAQGYDPCKKCNP